MSHSVLFTALTYLIVVGSIPTAYEFAEHKGFPKMPISLNNEVTVEGSELGRLLFYDPILSRDSTISCGTCHIQENAFAGLNEVFSKGIDGELTPRNTMPLFNLAWAKNYFWDGRVGSIEEQVFHPVRNKDEMDLSWPIAVSRIQQQGRYKKAFKKAFGTSSIDSVLVSKAIAQFLRTLVSANSKYDKVVSSRDYFSEDEYQGFIIANDASMGDCFHCHPTDGIALATTFAFSNNGLDDIQETSQYLDSGRAGVTKDEKDVGKFKIPSLRNVGVTAPYMHDGRFKTLEEVVDFYTSGVHQSINVDSKMGIGATGRTRLNETQKRQLIAFLHTLTDYEFISNPAFSRPE